MTDVATLRPSGRTDAADVEQFVARRVTTLQAARLEPGARGSRAVALLARLRRVATAEPGADPQTWDATIDGAPGTPEDPLISAPTKQERAIHVALAMYATAQQGRGEDAHERGMGLGRAVRRLERRRPSSGEGDVSPVRRRFDALATSATMPELAVHLRGLITQLRGEKITLDYARLARDLFVYQLPGQANAVRRSWARDFYARRAEAADDAAAGASATTPDKET